MAQLPSDLEQYKTGGSKYIGLPPDLEQYKTGGSKFLGQTTPVEQPATTSVEQTTTPSDTLPWPFKGKQWPWSQYSDELEQKNQSLPNVDITQPLVDELKNLDAKVGNNLARVPSMFANAMYYMEGMNKNQISLIPTLGLPKTELPFTSLTDAIKQGWTGENRTPTWKWTAGLLNDPREIETASQKFAIGWEKYPINVVSLIESLAISSVGWTGYGRIAETLKTNYVLGSIKTDKSFIQNVGSAIKQTIQTPKGMSDEDAVCLALYKYTGLKVRPEELSIAVRNNQDIIKQTNEELQALLYQKTHAYELYAQHIINKSQVDNIPEPEHIGDQKIDVTGTQPVVSDMTIKGAGKGKPITTDRIQPGANPLPEAQFENVMGPEQNATATVGKKDITSLTDLGYSDIQIRKMIPAEAQRVVDNSIKAETVSVLNDGTVKEIISPSKLMANRLIEDIFNSELPSKQDIRTMQSLGYDAGSIMHVTPEEVRAIVDGNITKAKYDKLISMARDSVNKISPKVSELADFVVGKQSDWDKLKVETRVAESKLKTRVEKNALNEPYQPLETRMKPAPTGAEAILQRLRLEQNFGNIPRTQVDAISRFIDSIGPDLVDDVGLSIRKKSAGRGGQFNYGNSLITLFKDNIVNGGGKFDRTTIHELWHTLSRYLPEEDLVKVSEQFNKEKSTFLKNNPYFEYAMDLEQGETLLKEHPEAADYIGPVYGNKGQQIGWKQLFTADSYKFKNIDEWFSETLTDKTFEHFRRMDGVVRNIFIHAADIVRKMIQGIERLFGYDHANVILNDFLKQKNTEIFRTDLLSHSPIFDIEGRITQKSKWYDVNNVSYLDDMTHKINEKKADAHINDTQVGETKLSKETVEQAVVRLNLEIANKERNLKLAQQGRLFLTPESQSRAVREEYARAYLLATKKGTPEIMKGKSKEAYNIQQAKKAQMPNKDFTHIVEVLTDQVSHGRTSDISGLTNDEFGTIFDAVNDMATMGPSLFYMTEHDILEMVNPAWDYLSRLDAPGVYHIPNTTAMQAMRDTHGWLNGWSDVLANVGISKKRGWLGKKLGEAGIVGTKNLDGLVTPNADNVIPRHPIGDVLRRMFLYADGISPYGDNFKHINPNTEAKLTPDEINFIKETSDKVGSGELKDNQINAEINGAQYVRNIMDQLSTLGERLGFLYDPDKTPLPDGTLKKNRYFTDEQLKANGAVPRRTNYVRHNIQQIVEDVNQMAKENKPYYLEGVRKFFEKNPKIKIDIPEMNLRQEQRIGMNQNIDTAFRTVIQHETFKFYMEPAFKQADKLARSVDGIHGVDVGDPKSVTSYTAKWINQAFRGQMVVSDSFFSEYKMNNIMKSVQRNAVHGVGKVISTIRKMLNKEPDNLFSQWQPDERAFRTFSNQYRRYVYGMAMGLNPSSALKNVTQVLLVNPIIGTRATLEGMKSVWVGGTDVLHHSDTYFARGVAIHELSLSGATKISNFISFPFRLVDQYINCASAFNGSLWKQIYKDSSKLDILRNYGYTGNSSGSSFWKALNKAIESGEFRGEVKMADMVTKRTQFSYLPWDMPKSLWSPVGKLGLQFTSYPMNYFTQYLPYLGRMAQTGVGPFGTISKAERYSLLKHIVQAEGIALMGELSGYDVSYVSPVHAAARSVYNTVQVWRRKQKPNEAPYQQGPLPSFPPAISSIQAIASGAGVMDSGRPSSLKAALTMVKTPLMMDQYASPSDWTGYLPGSALKTTAKVIGGKKSPLAFAGITPYSERRPGKRR